MEENRASRTALMTAYTRGYHAAHDRPTIFDDFLAHHLLSGEERSAVEDLMMTFLRRFNPVGAASFPDTGAALAWMMQTGAAPPIVLARARYAEESLEEAAGEGVRQYVILGAGMDTCPFRRPDLARRLRLFEVDHPATQAHKLRRLADLGWDMPPGLKFVPVDFTRQSLGAALAASSYDPHALTFFSWLGVTYYLPRDTVLATLREIAAIAPSGSMVVFDYLDCDAFLPWKAAPRVLLMLRSVRELGEPMQTGFDPLTIEAELAPLGLRLRDDLSPFDIHARFFLGRTDHYRACEHAHFACAVVE
ncbi:MAG: class I SAM-dependent methyltransferase [Geobacter sp.]|nr:class I SAM-dependent methyltransferase [Geobacter sp.]